MSKQPKEDAPSKELVRRNHVPLWDAMVENIINEMVITIKDPDLPSDVKGGVLHSKAKKLTKLVDQLDSGTTKYGALSPIDPDDYVEAELVEAEPVDEANTPTSIWQLTNDEVWKQLEQMDAAEKQAFINGVTTSRGSQS